VHIAPDARVELSVKPERARKRPDEQVRDPAVSGPTVQARPQPRRFHGTSRLDAIPLPTTLSDAALSLQREHEIGDTL